jgi:predicted PurR-regulated permease PerM
MRAGILGLFVGAVVMAIGYKIFRAYMDQPKA